MTQFIDTINQAADAWFNYVLHASWQSAVVGGALLLLTAFLWKGSSPVRYAILVVALTKFAMPPLWSAPIGLFGLVDIGSTTVPQAHAIDSFDSHRNAARAALLEDAAGWNSAGAETYVADVHVIPPQPVHAELPAVTVPDATAVAFSWKSELMFVHLAGALCIGGWIVMQFVKVRRLVARSQDVSGNSEAVASSLARLTSTLPDSGDVRVLLSADAIGPMTAGIWRPVVVLPKWCERLSPRELDAVLMHELTHVRRRDTWWVWIELVVCAAWWFHPVAWLVRRALRSVREECCDDAILASHIAKPADYCDTLLRIAAATGARRAAVLACEMAPRLHPLGGRMRRIMDSRARRSTKLTFASLAAIAAAAFVLLPGIVESDPHAALAEADAAVGQVETANATTQPPSNQTRTIRGLCVDQDGNPLPDVAVTLYQREKSYTPAAALKTATTGADGMFELVGIELQSDIYKCFVVAQAPGRSTAVENLRHDHRGELTLTLRDAATFSGTIRGEDDKPVPNAVVTFDIFGNYPVGVRTAKTDEQGKFAITDLGSYDIKDRAAEGSDGRVATFSLGVYFTVLHPDLARARLDCTKIPNDLDIVLAPAAIIEGTVLADGGVSTAGLEILAGLMEQEGAFVNGGRVSVGSVTVGQDGKYRIASLPAGKYKISVLNMPPTLTGTAIDSFEVKQGQVNIAPPLRLIAGGIIRGRLIDDYSGLPITFRPHESATVGLVGPASRSAKVAADGTFELRAVPGTNHIYLEGAGPNEVVIGKHNRNDGMRDTRQEVQVPDGGTVNVEIRLRRHPVSLNSNDNAQLRRHSKNERAAIAAFGASNEIDVGAKTQPSSSNKVVQLEPPKKDDTTRTIRGLCVDQDNNPLANVPVTLYQGERPMRPAITVRTVKTGIDGKFEMTNVELESESRWNFIAAQSPGRATAVHALRKDKHGELTLTLSDAATFSGTIRGEDGKPVPNALVSVDVFGRMPVGVRSAMTDEQGKFAIADLEKYDIKDHVVKSSDGRVASVSHQKWFTVLHPDFARTRIECTKIPNDVEILVEPAAIIEGRIETANKNFDMAGLEIAAQPISRQDGQVAYSGGVATVDQDGKYRLTSLVAGKYNISVFNFPPSLTAAAIDSFEAKQGQINIAPPIQLISGGIIRGQLIDDYSGRPITFREAEVATIGLHGPSRPRSGAMIQSTEVAADGTFEIRAVPGANYIYLMGASPHEVVLGEHNRTGDLLGDTMQEVQVPDGDVVNVEIRLRRHAVVHSSSESVRREWENERAAIAAIEALGGWCETEPQNGFAVVVEVNMVSHEDESGNRLECHLNTDEALFYVPKFKHLKRLILRGRQASDAGLKNVANLRELELISIDDAHFVSDEGIAHLRSLPNLRIVGITHSRATDQSIAYLSEVPTIERLSMRWSQFTDQAFEYAQRLPRLQELSIDKGNSHFTDEATRHAAEMPALATLSLLEAPISDAGLKNLETLSTLKTLALSESSVTADGIARLQAANPILRIWVHDRAYASLQELQSAVDPQQIEINARDALAGLATIEKYLELMANGANADATKIAERRLIREYRHYQPVPDVKGFRILEAYGDGNEVMALTTATFSAQAYDSNSDNLTRKLVTQIFLRASRQKDGSWKVTGQFDTERPDEAWQNYQKRWPSARKLEIATNN